MVKNFWKNKKVLVTGGNGFLGRHLVTKLKTFETKLIIIADRDKYDLRVYKDCLKATKGIDIVLHLAAKVGGIGFNRENPVEIFEDNILIGTYMMKAAYKNKVKKYVALGTICAYPKFTPVPFKEKDLWNGYPEETNAPYGLAKKMQLVQAQAYRQQYGFNSIFLLPVNMYGPGDNFDPKNSHVIPALVKKFVDAKNDNLDNVEVWGTGKATREFFYVEDAAEAIVKAAVDYNSSKPLNIGAGFEISIKELAEKIKKLTRYGGNIVWDKTKPDGQPRRRLDVTRARQEVGFVAKTDFEDGLKKTIEWYIANGR